MSIKWRPVSNNSLIFISIIIIAAALRLYGVSFGLPALYDPDEPFFTMTGLKLLSERTLNPGWFGHPGTTTIYVLAIIDSLVYFFGHLAGQIPNPKAFGVAIFTNPVIVALPSRYFFVLCGVACVWLTHAIGKRIWGDRVGLAGAGLLAINALHIQWSQVIRTDVQSSVFMLLCVLFSIRIVQDGRLRYYVAAAACVGLAAATKWPAASVIICPIGACLLRTGDHADEAGRRYWLLLLLALASMAALFMTSPYLLIDHRVAWAQMRGEAAPSHLGASSGGFLSNVIWYFTNPIGGSIGLLGLLLAALGFGIAAMRSRIALAVIIPCTVLFFFILCTQSLIWTRWVVPLLPFISLFVAVGFFAIGDRVRARFGARPALAARLLLGCAVAIPMVLTWRSQTIERLNDTRGLASAWIKANLPENSSLAIEYFAFDLLRGERRIYYPAGGIGCVYANELLRGGVHYNKTLKWRAGRTILDLGTVENSELDTCRADYALFTDYDRYKAEASAFPAEIATYHKLAKGGVQLKVFTPIPGKIGGPVVRIFKLAPRADGRVL